MSRATIEPALASLVPTLNGPLPPELVSLAVSLLARSRSVSHSLKPDEEIARPYACAQLACERYHPRAPVHHILTLPRLKKRLNLPAITPRPPCPPRIYKKLFNYLESALPASIAAREPQTPRKSVTSAPPSARGTPKTPLSARKTPRMTRNDRDKAQEPPEWTMPTVRALVKAFSYPLAAPHIYTGIESVLPLLARMSAAAAAAETPSKRPRRTSVIPPTSGAELSDARILSLLAVILFYVLSRMMDQDITPEQYIDWRMKAISTLLNTSPGKVFSEADIEAEIEELMPLAQAEGWLQMEWFLNVAPSVNAENMEGVEMADEMSGTATGARRKLRSEGSDYIGLGTMMQDATDYLSAGQREDYQRWKAAIIARVEQIEAS